MALKEVTYWGSRKALEDEYGVLYSLDEKELLMCRNHRLKDYVVREGTERIHGCGFKDHFEMESLKFPDSLVTIDGWAFENCKKLTSLEIPKGVTEIEERVFYECRKLERIFVFNPIPPICDNKYTFSGTNTVGCVLYVPKGAKEAYSNADGWRKFLHIEEMG